ncbi:hypothetical protein ACGFYQ_17455 [Streptomyces sp. NPDC048258]|uniref:hypothetical protein n=1 Tax=Streptomyces sp. NPDC048258 TaxID=3365527 RepID=UPI0037123844
MYRPHRLRRLLGTVLAVLAVVVGLAAVASAVIPAVPPTAAAPGPIPARAAAGPAPDAAQRHVAAVAEGGGPACAPVAPGHGGTPAVPTRAGGEHAQVPPARLCPEGARPYGTTPVRVLVRGPDRSAPGPVELSVMRV